MVLCIEFADKTLMNKAFNMDTGTKELFCAWHIIMLIPSGNLYSVDNVGVEIVLDSKQKVFLNKVCHSDIVAQCRATVLHSYWIVFASFVVCLRCQWSLSRLNAYHEIYMFNFISSMQNHHMGRSHCGIKKNIWVFPKFQLISNVCLIFLPILGKLKKTKCIDPKWPSIQIFTRLIVA